MLKKIAALLLLVPATLLFPGGRALATVQFTDLEAPSAILAEAGTGQILFEHNMNERRPVDSLAKIMTLLIAVTAVEDKAAREESIIEMTESAWFDVTSKNTTQNIKPGEKMSLLNLMYSAYVGSANEACNMIAEHIAGSVDSFIEMMNARAIELGCEGTNFTNTHGQYSSNQYTTARDQFLIFSEAMSKELFAEISGTFRHVTDSVDGSAQRTLRSSNSLLNASGKYYYRHCSAGLASAISDGGVTNATIESGYSTVAFAEADGLALIVVVLGASDVALEDGSTDLLNFTEARRLFEWGFTEFGWRTILSSNELVERAPIMHGAGADFVNLKAETEIKLLIENSVPIEDFVRTVNVYSEARNYQLVAPIQAGDILGEISLTRNGVEYGPIHLVANTSIELHRFEFIRMQVTDLMSSSGARYVIWGLAILVASYAVLVIRYNVIRRKRLNRIALAKRRIAEERMNAPDADLEYDIFRDDDNEMSMYHDLDLQPRRDLKPRSSAGQRPGQRPSPRR